MKISILLLLSCLLIGSLAIGGCELNAHLRSLVHNSKINHRFRVSHLAATYTSQEQAFMKKFDAEITGFIFGDT